MQFFKCIVILLSLFSIGTVEADEVPETTTEEFDARVGIADDLSHSTEHPRLGDIPLLNRKVIKANRVTIREHPYAASIRREMSHYTTGAILSKNLFVTVAHPLYNVALTELGVVLGENYSDRGSTVSTVVLTIFHEEFNPYTLQNDIVLLRTFEEVSFTGAIKPIKLYTPVKDAEMNGQKAFVTGWGRCDNMGTELCLARSSRHFPNERMDPMLRSISFDIVQPNLRCLDYKQYDIRIYPGMVCMGLSREDDQTCPCLGSPGALLVSRSCLLGMQSWGFGCGYLYDLPLVYTDVYYYIPWLLQNIMLLRNIHQSNLTELFEATRAAILSEWIFKTRSITPKPGIQTDKSLERLDIDVHLVKLHGTVYDIRDYISDGAFHEEKVVMYNNLMEKAAKATKSSPTTKPMEGTPFLGAEAKKIAYGIDATFASRTDVPKNTNSIDPDTDSDDEDSVTEDV